MKLFTFLFIILSFGLIVTSCGGTSDGFAPSSDLASTLPTPGVAPGAVTITSPAILSAITNTSLTITGVCQIGATVNLSGNDTQSTSCPAGSFSFSVSNASSGAYSFNISQTNASGTSPSVTVLWTLDMQIPAQLTITSPLSNPYVSGDDTLTLTGACETGCTVNITGDYVGSTSCIAGSYTISGITKTVDGAYNFSLTQTDSAANVSNAKSFSWTRDTLTPPTPTITTFTDNPHYTKTSPLTVGGDCVTGNTVYIVENGTTLNSMLCAGNAYSLSIAKGANGTYNLAVYQTEPTNLTDSATRDFTWVYDSVAPSAPVISNPTNRISAGYL